MVGAVVPSDHRVPTALCHPPSLARRSTKIRNTLGPRIPHQLSPACDARSTLRELEPLTSTSFQFSTYISSVSSPHRPILLWRSQRDMIIHTRGRQGSTCVVRLQARWENLTPLFNGCVGRMLTSLPNIGKHFARPKRLGHQILR